MTSLQVEASGLAGEIRSDVEKRLRDAGEEVRRDIAPRLQEVTDLLSQVVLLRVGRGTGEAPSELEKLLLARFQLITAELELRTVDALQDSLEGTVSRLVRAGFGLLLST